MKSEYLLDKRVVGFWLLLGAIVTAVATFACVLWVDLPTARWLHDAGLDQHSWMRRLLDAPVVLGPFALIYCFVYPVRASLGSTSHREHAWFVISVTLLVALQVKTILKIVFGRTWPRDVKNIELAGSDGVVPEYVARGFLNDGVHGFFWLSGADKPYAAFPSGSTAALVSVALPIAIMFPRLRFVISLYCFASFAAFVITNTHFVGDVIAGAYIGAACALVGASAIKVART